VYSWAVHPCGDTLPYICQLPAGLWTCQARWGLLGDAGKGCVLMLHVMARVAGDRM
jgi:hypothetical protein